jgi:hypothetical protein
MSIPDHFFQKIKLQKYQDPDQPPDLDPDPEPLVIDITTYPSALYLDPDQDLPHNVVDPQHSY